MALTLNETKSDRNRTGVIRQLVALEKMEREELEEK